jgi:hypothetical protein
MPGAGAPPVPTIKLTETQEITPYQWCIRGRTSKAHGEGLSKSS